ncbi:Chitin synthase, class 2 [Actinomortierella wolfii]|nr:Chitin synthase, class 2 [Actinomortierella wolfii]
MDDQYKGPLKAYFEPDYLVFNKDEDDDIGDVLKYSYFAEDQILPFLVTTLPHRSYRMKYVRSAWAETELPSGVGSFLGKKRKWQNRRFFGLLYAWFHIGAVWRSGHNFLRKLMLTLEIIYLACDTAFWFLALGNYYIVFYYMSKSLATATKLSSSEIGFTFIRYIYICLIVVVMMISMGNRPRGWGIKAKEDEDVDPLIHRTEIYHASTVHVPDEQSVDASYEEACEDLNIHDLHKFRLFSPSNPLLPFHHSNNSPPNKHEPSSINATGAAASKSKTAPQKPKESKAEKKARIQREKELAKLDKLTTKKKNSYRYRTDLVTLQSDFYQRFRTRILLLWIIANGALVISITADELAPYLILEDGSNLYVTLVVWIITAGAAGRFFGTVAYLLGWVWYLIRG